MKYTYKIFDKRNQARLVLHSKLHVFNNYYIQSMSPVSYMRCYSIGDVVTKHKFRQELISF